MIGSFLLGVATGREGVGDKYGGSDFCEGGAAVGETSACRVEQDTD